MLNRISEIGIHISIQNLLRKETVNDISRYDVAVSTLGKKRLGRFKATQLATLQLVLPAMKWYKTAMI